jgi:hypothetical protein
MIGTGVWGGVCLHGDLSGPDAVGGRLCLGCGVHVPGLRADIMRGIEMMRRDFGVGGRHLMRCVETPDGWCCASGCEIGAGG